MSIDALYAAINSLSNHNPGCTEARLKQTLQRAVASDPIRAFVYRADAYDKAQLGWPRHKNGSSSALLLSGLVAFVEAPGSLEKLSIEDLKQRLEAAEEAIRDTALAHYGGPREGGMADMIRKARKALHPGDPAVLNTLAEALESSSDPGTSAIRHLVRGLQGGMW